jgi:hypothetical protein
MKRKWLLLLGITCVTLVFGACASKPIVFDENLPLEESVRLCIYFGLEIKEYNGIPIQQKKFLLDSYSTWHDVYLPPGEMEFMADVNEKRGNFIYTANNVYFRYKFDAGKYYSLLFVTSGEGPDENQWGVRIYDSPPPTAGYPPKDKIIDFTPFYKKS